MNYNNRGLTNISKTINKHFGSSPKWMDNTHLQQANPKVLEATMISDRLTWINPISLHFFSARSGWTHSLTEARSDIWRLTPWLIDLAFKTLSDIALTQFFVKLLMVSVSQSVTVSPIDPAVPDLLANFLPGWLWHTEKTAGDIHCLQALCQMRTGQDVWQILCQTSGDVCQPLCQTSGDVCQPLCQTSGDVCQPLCQTSGDVCQTYCQTLCQTYGDVCQPLCQTSGDVCQTYCQTLCQTYGDVCQPLCQTYGDVCQTLCQTRQLVDALFAVREISSSRRRVPLYVWTDSPTWEKDGSLLSQFNSNCNTTSELISHSVL